MTSPKQSCCAPTREAQTATLPDPSSNQRRGGPPPDAVKIPGGKAWLGTDKPELPEDGEAPLRQKKIKPFLIGTAAITNREFAAFAQDTGYVTEAETLGTSFVFWSQLPSDAQVSRGVVGAEWWREVEGANWQAIAGPNTPDGIWQADHPVVHVSWRDAHAYAAWAGGRLPKEAEWEHAARGGQGDVRFPWGDQEPDDETSVPCNIWQGDFPQRNTIADGWEFTAPARSFDPNPFGLYNMVGNVWEWTSEPFRTPSLKRANQARMKSLRGFKALKGGSYLCHRSYCHRYRIAARIGNAPSSTTSHQGFRVVWDI